MVGDTKYHISCPVAKIKLSTIGLPEQLPQLAKLILMFSLFLRSIKVGRVD